MPDLKHVGRTKNNRKCIVAYRVIPGDPNNCLVIHPETLDADQHDSLMKLVESNTGQAAYELAEAMHRTTLVDGRNMLRAFHTQGKLVKASTKDIVMVPNSLSSINLAELNELIANQKGVSVADLALGADKIKKAPEEQKTEADTVSDYSQETATPEVTDNAASSEPLSDDELAKQLRSQADAMFKEAKRLREQAEELVPIKKKTTKKTETSA